MNFNLEHSIDLVVKCQKHRIKNYNVSIHIYQPFRQGRIWHKVNF